VGFGFLDNFTMIIAGDYIEHSLGLIMTISTMAAAALGNTISDVLGIGSAVYVERFVEVIGVRPPDLTPVQLEMKSARRASNLVSELLARDWIFAAIFDSISFSFPFPLPKTRAAFWELQLDVFWVWFR
jgi:Transmembrane protein 65